MQENSQTYGYYNASKTEEDGFDFKKLLLIFLLHWKWILFSLIVCLAAAVLYLRITPRIYTGELKILIKDDNTRHRATNDIDLSGVMGLTMATNGFENELEIIKSSYLASRAVKQLKLYATYKLEGRVVDHDVYNDTPIVVDLEESRLDDLHTILNVTITKVGNGYDVTCQAGLGRDVEGQYSASKHLKKLPETMSTPLGTLMFTPNPTTEKEGEEALANHKLVVTISPVMWVARNYAEKLSVSPTSKTANVAMLSISDNNRKRIMDYLKMVIEKYNEDANEDKSAVGKKTEEFINERLLMIRDELDSTELNLQKFKQNNALVDLHNDAAVAVTGTNEYQRKQVEMQTQQTIVRSLLNYVSNPANAYKVLPSSSLVSGSPSLAKQIDDYNAIIMERDRLLKTSSPSAPVIVKLTEQMEASLPLIQQSLQLYDANLRTEKAGIDRQFAHYSGKVVSTPGRERALNSIARQQEVKAGLYLMLLQKREENAITQAYTAVKARVIDVDDAELLRKVSPKTTMVLGLATILGIGLPIAIFFLLEMLRYRIEGREDVEKLTKIPILADIPTSKDIKKGERAVVVHANSNNTMEEAFRGLRTNLRFVMHADEKVLLVTSVIPGEGKTFVATNLAVSIALLGKHVLLIGLDVRKPRLVNLFGLNDKQKGLTQYLMTDGEDYKLLEEQIFPGIANPNLDVLPAGVIPPNPGELMGQPQLRMAIDYMRQKYDFIVIDTPPVGLVSDTFDIAAYADASLVVCRSEVSPKSNFELINQCKDENKLPKVNLVLNGIDLSRKKYGYYYGGKYKYYGHYGRYGTYGNYGDQKK